MGKIICVEFQMKPLKFYTKYLTNMMEDTICTLLLTRKAALELWTYFLGNWDRYFLHI